ncbi:hypothetical protein [Streptococcus loxodontisalivarius]|uniref:Transposase n=1 Tax=Streptococcus loxodontisalivarius TaxID=1349415 RepID=A0ABS2PQY8_9STRE|nr:hypothetical protein [Streptococcus loxodontisalivarius]MBM7641955.1 hypothetical protein [Streptococcus loxodontisalivarius]
MNKKTKLSNKEAEALQVYQSKKLHHFREILAYCAILEKLTKL